MVNPVRTVVFDAVGTLVTPDPPAGVAYHRAGCRRGSSRTESEVVRRFAEAFHATLRRVGGGVHRTDDATERAFWRSVVSTVFDDLSVADCDACFDDLFAHFARPEAWRVYPDVGPVLRDLRSLGLETAVASNFDARLHAVFEGHAELGPIERRFVSSEVGWRKPDARFFRAVCDGLGRRPAEVLYVGDEPESDVAAAVAAGLPALLLRRGETPGPGALSELTELPARLAQTAGNRSS